MKNHIWVLERRHPDHGYVPINFFYNRERARDTAKYFNGFSYRTKSAKYRVRKYIDAGIGAT
jgi:hypothetical protein